MDLKKNLLPVACLSFSLLGLVLIYLAAINISPTRTEISEISAESVGKSVTVSGKITYASLHPAGHLFLTISDGANSIQVPLFAGFISQLNDAGVSTQDLKKGVEIEITGLVGEYRGELQVVPRKTDDVKILDGSDDS